MRYFRPHNCGRQVKVFRPSSYLSGESQSGFKVGSATGRFSVNVNGKSIPRPRRQIFALYGWPHWSFQD